MTRAFRCGILLGLIGGRLVIATAADEAAPPQGPAQVSAGYATLRPSAAAIEAWKDARFGMFISWGPVSLKGTEIGWSRKGEQRDMKEPRVHAMRAPAE